MNLSRTMASFVRRSGVWAAFFLTALQSSISVAAPTLRTDFPCKGCLFLPPPDGASKAPLLVVLHGDAPGGKTPLVKRDSESFVAASIERGIAVFAPMCPKSEGCNVGSFWQWSQGDPPAWIASQIDVLRKESSIDPNRIWIAGWSGGASFLGYHYSRLAEHYGAVIFAGGGIAPFSKTCAPCSPPAYFLVGDKNPLHHLAKDLRASIDACTNDVTWDLLPGKDHAGEWRALKDPHKVGELLDWLAKHPRKCPDAPEKLAIALPSPSSSSSSAPTTPETTHPITAPSAVRIAPSEKHGACTISEPVPLRHGAWWFVVSLVVVAARRRCSDRTRDNSR
jgi:hypothetical protein